MSEQWVLFYLHTYPVDYSIPLKFYFRFDGASEGNERIFLMLMVSTTVMNGFFLTFTAFLEVFFRRKAAHTPLLAWNPSESLWLLRTAALLLAVSFSIDRAL